MDHGSGIHGGLRRADAGPPALADGALRRGARHQRRDPDRSVRGRRGRGGSGPGQCRAPRGRPPPGPARTASRGGSHGAVRGAVREAQGDRPVARRDPPGAGHPPVRPIRSAGRPRPARRARRELPGRVPAGARRRPVDGPGRDARHRRRRRVVGRLPALRRLRGPVALRVLRARVRRGDDGRAPGRRPRRRRRTGGRGRGGHRRAGGGGRRRAGRGHLRAAGRPGAPSPHGCGRSAPVRGALQRARHGRAPRAPSCRCGRGGAGVKVALVTGLCQHRDAISNAVMAEREVLVAAGHEVTVFTHFTDRLAGDEVVVIVDPWKLQQVPAYRDADVVVFHYGIQYELFNALLLGHPRAALVVRFHNVTPPALLDGDPAAAAARAIDQISIADRAHVVWSDSRHNTDVLVTHADVERDQVRLLPLCVPMVEAELRPRVAHPRLRIDVTDDELHASYAGADVFVSPSHHEGFCIPVIEALANDCVVVTSDAGALPDTVGGFGDVVPAGDSAALAAALGRAITEARDPDRAAGAPARRAARASYLAQFGPTRFAARLLDEVQRAANLGSPFAGDPPRRDAARFAARHGRLLSRLACPECRSHLAVVSPVEAHGTVAEAELVCATHGRQGVVDSFRPGFLPRCLDRWDARPRGVIDDSLDLVRDTETRGEWGLIRQGLVCGGQARETLTFETGAPGFEVRFHGHARSGRVEIRVDGHATNVVDLYRYEPGEVIVDSGPLGTGPHQVELVAVGPAAVPERSQVIVARIVRRSGADEAWVPNLAARNRGNPYPERFAKLLVDVPADGLVLDCGGGDRRFGDDRVINLEYLDYDLVDIYGDGLALPFADGAFDLVMSQAVLEHVPDPEAAVDEMVRLLRPGGVLYVEVAFMQPVHAVPYHFMNVTPHGLAHLCRALEVEDSGTFGGLEVTMGWFVDLLDARRRVGGDRVEHMLATLRDLDASLSPADLAQLASAVHLTGRKPIGG